MAEWFSTDSDLLWYLGIVIAFFAFFIWNSTRLKRNRAKQKKRNFRKRFMDRKKNVSKEE